jgi:hypothetical protein
MLFAALALMLCMGVFFVTAYAASATPPTVSARITGDMLCVEVQDGQSGVEAVYIGDIRVNYLVDGKVELPAAQYAGKEQHISIYAVDFAGVKSNTAQVLNPFYINPATTPPPVTPTPALIPAAPAPIIAEPVTEEEHQPAQSAAPSKLNPFTPDGEGEVVDNALENDGKEFFTIDTEAGNVFYLVIDRQRSENNVYLLNAVTERDLAALAEGSGGTESAVTTPEQPVETQPPPQETPEPPPEAEEEPPEPASNNGSMIVLVLIVIIGVGGAGYYFKIVRGRNAAPDDTEGEYDDEDEYGYDDETEDDFDDSGQKSEEDPEEKHDE